MKGFFFTMGLYKSAPDRFFFTMRLYKSAPDRSIYHCLHPEPKNYYHSDTGTLFLFDNYAKVQNHDSLVDIYQYTFNILFTLSLPVDQNLTKRFSCHIKLHKIPLIMY